MAVSAFAETITVYSGRSESLIGPAIERFEEQSGHDVEVRYGGTAELAALLLEEGRRTPADVYIAQDAGALGALAAENRLRTLPSEILERVPAEFRSPAGQWVGVTGRARTIVYNTNELSETDVPDSVFDLADPKWKGRVAWAPANGSFQSFVTAMRVTHGDERTAEWLRGMVANDAKVYPKNSAIVRAVGAGEIELGLVNHYYLLRFKAEDPGFPAENHYTRAGDPGTLVNVAGAAILRSSRRDAETLEAAHELLRYLLSEQAQKDFATRTYEYPLIDGVAPAESLQPLDEITTPEIDLSDLSDLRGTLDLLHETGALP
jgi:iron(III) transport system substrate-binding protein